MSQNLLISLCIFFSFFVIAVVGQRGIQRNHNYENKWGAMFFSGSVGAVLSFIAVIVVAISYVF